MSDEGDYLGKGLLIFGVYIPLSLFVIGLLFGSFLNVCIYRLPRGLSVVRPRSSCPKCKASIRWYDNIPVLSVLILRGRCRHCGKAIGFQYIAVEIAFAVWLVVDYFVTLSRSVGMAPPFVLVAVLSFLLIGLMVMDWQTQRLPDTFTLTGTAIGFLLVCVQAFFLAPGEGDIVLNSTHQLRLSSPGSFTAQGNVFLTGTEALIMGRIAAIAGAALILLAVRWTYKALRKRDGMGLGDVKLLAMIAAFLGFSESLLALFAGVLAASVFGLFLIARRNAGAETKLPFGSFLAAGGLLAALFGPRIVGWYASLLR
jgi:leader peptidase (prepilin peptidase) / N-methyltransferase